MYAFYFVCASTVLFSDCEMQGKTMHFIVNLDVLIYFIMLCILFVYTVRVYCIILCILFVYTVRVYYIILCILFVYTVRYYGKYHELSLFYV